MSVIKLKHSIKFSKSIKSILFSLNLKPKHGESNKPAVFSNDIKVSIAVIDLSGKNAIEGGYNMDEFIYPAPACIKFLSQLKR